jgi:hypothetical protein
MQLIKKLLMIRRRRRPAARHSRFPAVNSLLDEAGPIIDRPKTEGAPT